MRRRLWYNFIRFTLQTGFLFYFKSFKVLGKKKNVSLDKKKAIIYLPNHENAFMDALAIATSSPRMSHYMARADIFTNPTLIWAMATINLRPIYRIRDGKKAVAKNEKVFRDLINYLGDGECVMIHPEGTHNLDYRLRPLNKGFTRLAFGFLEKFPDRELDIIPVGINYDNHTDYRSKGSIEYGEPIDAKPYFDREDRNEAVAELVKRVSDDIKGMITHIEPAEEYQEKYAKMRKAGADFSDSRDTNEKLEKINRGESLPDAKPCKPSILDRLLYPIAYINNIVLVLLWKKFKPVFKDKAWHGPIKFALGTYLGPLLYSIQTLVVWLIFGPVWAFLYLFFSFVTLPSLRIGQKNTNC